METGTLLSKGQITIPKKIRDFLHIQESEKVIFIPLEKVQAVICQAEKLFSFDRKHQNRFPGFVTEN